MYKCSKCNKEFKTYQGLNSHKSWCNKSFRKKNRNMKGKNNPHFGKKGGNQFTKAKEEGRTIIISEETRKKISKANKNRIWTQEQRDVQSIVMQKAVREHPESYSANNICGRTKIIEYKGFKLNGKWELEVAKWLDKQGIEWTNKVKGVEYLWEDKNHLYFPDFYLPKLNKYIEVKGYERERDRKKWKNLSNLIIIKEKEIKWIMNNKKEIENIFN